MNIFIGCIYKHPNVSIKEFHDDYLSELDKLPKEKKATGLLCDFNINIILPLLGF